MKSLTIILLFISIPITCKSWEYCQSNIEKELCGELRHYVCDAKESIPEPSQTSTEFLAHVPLTRKLKKAFLNWHNYYRNRTAGGHVKNKNNVRFPKAARMRELIWDAELSFLSHFRTKLVNNGEVDCSGTQRFPYAGQNIVVQALDEPKPVLEIVYLSLKEMFDGKNTIPYPYDMPALFTTDHLEGKQFTIMVNDRVSRLGCAVSLGSDCTKQKGGVMHQYCYYTTCTYDYGLGGRIYKKGKSARRCSIWGVGTSETYINLCANSGKIFDYNE